MNTIDLLNQKVSYFDKANDSSKAYKTMSIIDFLTTTTIANQAKIEYLRRLNKKSEEEAKAYKKSEIPSITVSGTFNRRRVVGDIKDKTGIIAIDIDKDNNPCLDIEKTKKEVMKLPYVFLSGLSCRGEGVYCFIYYNKENYIGYVFNALEQIFKNLGYVVDHKCRDITRLRFVSYDSNMLLKQEVEMFNETYIPPEREPYECTSEWVLTKDDVKDIVTCVYVLTHYFNYRSDDYEEWLLDGFRLATLPNKQVGLKLFEMISEVSDNFEGYDDVENKFNECYNTTTYKTNILGYYINKVKEHYGPDWRFRVNDLLKGKKIQS